MSFTYSIFTNTNGIWQLSQKSDELLKQLPLTVQKLLFLRDDFSVFRSGSAKGN